VRTIIAARKPVSAAGGELLEALPAPQCSAKLQFLKWGPAGCGRRADWPNRLDVAADAMPTFCRPVAVAYADWQRAEAPWPAEICAFACDRRWGAFLIDTWRKDGQTLLDFLPMPQIAALVNRCRDAGVSVALAGSLGQPQIELLLPLAPDWFAVRGAVCRQGKRNARIDHQRVRHFADLLARRASERTLARASG
jgi:hypothetical protein